MDDFTKRSVDDFLDQVSDRTPTPGGGGVNALAGALGCSLARMVAAYSVGKKTQPDVRDQVGELARRLHRADELLRALITRDAVVYADMTAKAPSMGRKGERTAAEDQAYQDAVATAIAVPMEMAAVASTALATMDELKTVANRFLLSDLAMAAVLADATARCARYTVLINAAELKDSVVRRKRLAETDAMIEHCRRRCESIEGFVTGGLITAAESSR